jgi:hypothetical protein
MQSLVSVVFAAFSTTRDGVAEALILSSSRPELLQRLRAEVDSVPQLDAER